MGKRKPSQLTQTESRTPEPDVHKAIGSGTAIITAFAALASVIVAGIVGYSQIHSAPSPALQAEGVPSSEAEPPSALSAVRKAPPPEKAGGGIKVLKSKMQPPAEVVVLPPPPPIVSPPPLVQTVLPPRVLATITMPVGIRLRAEPNTQAATVAVVEPNQSIRLGEKIGQYFYAELASGTRGFIRADLVAASRSGKAIPTDEDGVASQSPLPAPNQSQE